MVLGLEPAGGRMFHLSRLFLFLRWFFKMLMMEGQSSFFILAFGGPIVYRVFL